jgi:hypothetical protein
MSQYFKQVNLDLSGLDLARIQGGELFDGYGDSFRTYHVLDLDYLNSYLDSRIHFHIEPNFTTYVGMSGEGTAWPHSERLSPYPTVLNYYFETNLATTQFWTTKPGQDPGVSDPVLTDQGWEDSPVKRYRHEDLVYEDGFVAHANSAWLLDVACIHSVGLPQRSTSRRVLTHVRKFIRMSWQSLSVEQVFDSIELLGS